MSAIPTSLNYQMKPSYVSASSKTVQFPALNATYTNTGSNIIRINISGDEATYLNSGESYLRAQITNNSGAAFTFDSSAVSCITRVRILAGGQVISDIQNYGQLFSYLMNIQSSDDFERFSQIGMGRGLAVADGASVIVAIPLISGFLSGATGRYIPLGFINGGITLEAYLEPNIGRACNAAAAFGAGASFQFSNVYYIANTITVLDSNVQALMKQKLLTEGLSLSCTDFICYENTAVNNNVNVLIPNRSQSLKSLITLMSHPAPANNISGISSFKYGLATYNYRLGNGMQFPVIPVQSAAGLAQLIEPFAEAVKCFSGSIFSLNNHCLCTPGIFGNDNTFADPGAFSLSADFESFSNEQGAESGMNMSAMSSPISLSATFTLIPAGGARVLTYAHQDIIVKIQPDGSVLVSA